jgi:hypothetical protein
MVAYIHAEKTIFRYITNSDVPNTQSNIVHILKIYGKEQRLTREDIFLRMFRYSVKCWLWSFIDGRHNSDWGTGCARLRVFCWPQPPRRTGMSILGRLIWGCPLTTRFARSSHSSLDISQFQCALTCARRTCVGPVYANIRRAGLAALE